MNVGIIGAGKVGISFAKYFFGEKSKFNLSGFYSKTFNSALYASKLTNSRAYKDVEELVKESKIIIIATPDDAIKNIWDEIKDSFSEEKIVAHCSGSLSTNVFSDIEQMKTKVISIHPMLAIKSKENSYQDLKFAFFTLQGDKKAIDIFEDILKEKGNNYKILNSEDKVRYHLSAVLISNLMLSLSELSVSILLDYGFNEEEARNALENLAKNNMENFFNNGILNSITGPIERNDIKTISNHIDSIRNDTLTKDIYTSLSLNLLKSAKIKNKDKDYTELENLLKSRSIKNEKHSS